MLPQDYVIQISKSEDGTTFSASFVHKTAEGRFGFFAEGITELEAIQALYTELHKRGYLGITNFP